MAHEDIPLRASVVRDMVGYEIGHCLFPDMEHRSLDSLFVNDCCLINYLHAPQSGHFCCIVRVGDIVTYFNPTGRFPDGAIDYLGDYGKISNQSYPWLLAKLSDSPYQVRYMDFKLQDDKTNTCGRWCALFMRLRDIGDDRFIELFKSFTPQDIIKVTNLLIK